MRQTDLREVEDVKKILVRYAELGLKSERVRSRFLRQLMNNISEDLLKGGIEHILSSTRGRVFIETDTIDNSLDILRTIPGIYSFSVVDEVPSSMDELMDGMAEHARSRLHEGMSFGIKVRRTGETDYNSREIAIAGGDAVCRHLDDSTVSVDLKDPDIWFEVEIRGDRAYLFNDRIKGMGGMPYDTQGKVILFLPHTDSFSIGKSEVQMRADLSYLMMRRRGCKVIPVVTEGSLEIWKERIEEMTRGSGRPFVIEGKDLSAELIFAVRKTGSFGLVHPAPEEESEMVPILHAVGGSVSVFQPTVGFDPGEVDSWIKRLR